MNYEMGDELTLDDNKCYVVVDSFELNNNRYIYLVDKESKNASLVKIINDSLNEIDDDNEFNMALNELVNRNKDKINGILRETNE